MIENEIFINFDNGFEQLIFFMHEYCFRSGQLEGANIRTYLLEKTRVVHQSAGECNFHIFYQVGYILGQLEGANIRTYLLEKTRVEHQSAGECNFHIFYQVGFILGQLEGANIRTYLLEKTRVEHQSAGECNFHIFYQVGLSGMRIFLFLEDFLFFDQKLLK